MFDDVLFIVLILWVNTLLWYFVHICGRRNEGGGGNNTIPDYNWGRWGLPNIAREQNLKSF